MAAKCLVKRVKLAQEVAKLAGTSSLPLRVNAAMKAGFIGSLATPLRGLAGNTVSITSKTLPLQPMQAGINYLAAVGRAAYESAKQGKRISHLEYQTVINGTNKPGMEAFARGMKKGWNEVKDAFGEGKAAYKETYADEMTKKALGEYDKALPGSPFTRALNAGVQEMKLHIVDANKTASLLDYTPTTFKNPLAQAMTDAAFLLAEAVDRPTYYAAEEMSLIMQKRLAAMKAGATGSQIDAIANMMETTDEMALQATIDANRVTFKDRGLLAKSIEELKRSAERASQSEQAGKSAAGTVGLLVANSQMPFTGVPTSIATQGLETTPLGALGLLANFTVNSEGKFPRKIKLREQGLGATRNSQIVANTLFGTGAVAYGYWLAEQGYITGKLTPEERAEDGTRKDYTLNTPWGSFGLQVLGPLAVPLFAGASLYKAQKKDPSLDPVSLEGGLRIGRSGLEQTVNATYMQGLKQTVDAFGDADKSMTGMMANAVPIPSAVTQVSRFIDPQPREARTIAERILNKTPFSSTLPPATDATGVVPERTMGERIAAFASPIQYTAKRENAAKDELARLGVTIGKPAKVMQVNNQKGELSPAGMKDITTKQGEYILPMVERRLKEEGKDAYPTWTDERKQNYWEKVITAQKARAKIEAKKQFKDTTSGFFTGARR